MKMEICGIERNDNSKGAMLSWGVHAEWLYFPKEDSLGWLIHADNSGNLLASRLG